MADENVFTFPAFFDPAFDDESHPMDAVSKYLRKMGMESISLVDEEVLHIMHPYERLEPILVSYIVYLERLEIAYVNIGRRFAVDHCLHLLNLRQTPDMLRTETDLIFERFPRAYIEAIRREISSVSLMRADLYNAPKLKLHLKNQASRFLSNRYLFALAGFEQILAEYLTRNNMPHKSKALRELIAPAYLGTPDIPMQLLTDERIVPVSAVESKLPGRGYICDFEFGPVEPSSPKM